MYLNFFLNKNKPLAAITLKIMNEDTIHLVQTPLRITPEMWDEKKERPKNIYLKTYKILNQRLNRLKVGIVAYVQERKGAVSLAGLNRQVRKLTLQKSNAAYKNGSLLYHMDSYINSREHLISHSTYKRYVVFIRMIERYEGYCMKELMINEVNAEFVKRFLEFGYDEQYSKSTIYRSIHFVKTILNFLEKRGIRTFSYEVEVPKIAKPKKDFITLDEHELQTIQETAVPDQLKTAKDWLIISCFTGQRVSDFMDFTSDKLKVIKDKKCIAFTQKKTDKNILLPLHPTVLQIIREEERFPGKLSVQQYNLQIKEVARLAGITSKIKVRKRRGFRSRTETIQKWEAVSSHIGRRSFASNFYGKIPTPLLMEATGHSTEEMFKRYICNADSERALLLGSYFEKNYL
ncbi:MAG: tyrosine-type recombinase/integrase [Flavobacterium nitrogenifigens]|uniref:tyrosine-type recombinase/integrase n=1 Tax=Flavobacterium nitrogenifigens TaxID=1617283 RepID=UPI002806C728|nr:tyrosine-type recombinase/integrase [Flavobacterium nitrogenifigens]MDQ8015087.1 tyrosine-type recombinase/integrase [Flavobacterium nitrogenifigens]